MWVPVAEELGREVGDTVGHLQGGSCGLTWRAEELGSEIGRGHRGLKGAHWRSVVSQKQNAYWVHQRKQYGSRLGWL